MRRCGIVAASLVALAAFAAPAAAGTRIVTSFEDDLRNPPRGSLRFHLGNASAGDTIAFAGEGTVELAGPLEVRTGQLLIRGPATIRGGERVVLALAGERTTLRGLTLAVPLRVAGSGSAVAGNRFEAAALRAPALTVGEPGRGLPIVVERNAFAGVDFAVGVLVAQQSDVRIAGNRFELDGNGAVRTAGRGARRVEVVGNTVSGRSSLPAIDVTSDDTLVAGNVVTARGEPYGIEANGTIRLNRLRGSGIAVEGGGFRVTSNSVQGAPRDGIVVRDPVAPGPAALWPPGVLAGNRVEGSRRHGIVVGLEPFGRWRDLPVQVRGGSSRRNGGAGILLEVRNVDISSVAFGRNRGAAIDTAFSSPPEPPALAYSARTGKLEGTTCSGCLVEVYAVEEPPHVGDEGRGEGVRPLGRVRAGADGRFAFPQEGSLDCPESGLVSATRTEPFELAYYDVRGKARREGWRRTSAFARNVECACVYSEEFDVVPRDVPDSGFTNPGITVSFPRGARVGEVALVDTKTDRRPPPGYGGYPLQWTELPIGRPFPDVVEGRFRQGFGVSFSPRRGATYAQYANAPRSRWRYTIRYTVPRGQPCGARPATR